MRRREKKKLHRLTGRDHDEILRRLANGETQVQAAAAVGSSERSVRRFLARPRADRRPARAWSPHRLSALEREEICLGIRSGQSFRSIATRLRRAPSTISREVKWNGGREKYRASTAEKTASKRNQRARPTKFERYPRLRRAVETKLEECWSPQQIAARLAQDYRADPTMRVSHETIYRSLFVQTKGALRKELTAYLRTGRARRRSHARAVLRGRIVDMTMVSDRPARASDRAVPGHWEGDLIVGKGSKSAVATLVERRSRYLILVGLPSGSRTASDVRRALEREVMRLPAQLRQTLTWDQGREMAGHAQFTTATAMQVYFCDPHSPWQRGSNENTNGLVRQYFPKSTDLSVHSQAQLNAVARELNGRPRQTLGWMKPCEVFNAVASTA